MKNEYNPMKGGTNKRTDSMAKRLLIRQKLLSFFPPDSFIVCVCVSVWKDPSDLFVSFRSYL